MVVFVTGSTGFIGRHFVGKMLARLAPIDRIYLLQRRPADEDTPRATVLLGDLRQIDDHAERLRECHWIFYLAADASYGRGSHYAEINLAPVRRMIANGFSVNSRCAQRRERFVGPGNRSARNNHGGSAGSTASIARLEISRADCGLASSAAVRPLVPAAPPVLRRTLGFRP